MAMYFECNPNNMNNCVYMGLTNCLLLLSAVAVNPLLKYQALNYIRSLIPILTSLRFPGCYLG